MAQVGLYCSPSRLNRYCCDCDRAWPDRTLEHWPSSAGARLSTSWADNCVVHCLVWTRVAMVGKSGCSG